MKKVIIAVFLILFLWKCGCTGNGERNYADASTSQTSNKFLAYNYAEDFVKKRLKSPSSAEFPGVSEKNQHIQELGNHKYKITSWVDSQNSFGAMIRSRFSCTIIFESNSVRAENLIIE